MLRAVWSNDRDTFDSVWSWTKENLRVRGDHLFAWKYKDGVLDRNLPKKSGNGLRRIAVQ